MKLLNVLLIIAVALPVSSIVPASAKVPPDEAQRRRELIHNDLLEIYLNQNRRPDAIKEYTTLLSYKPNDAELNFKYGRYLAAGGNEAGSVPFLTKACTNDPMNATYAGTLGTAYLRSKNFPKAVEYLRKASALPGGQKYAKQYQDAFKYIQYEHQREAMEKRKIEFKKQQDENKKQMQKKQEDDW
ncbi:MAG: tetratricopeptide repeat protein [Cyanobacteria bacterium]|nr:tetratricopeptide repeat protein [Cyanobacteriota bacterium]